MSTLAAPPQSARTADQARRLLVGRDAPFSPEEGAAAIRALADQGDADALSALAKRAIERKTGARGLRSIMEAILLDTMFELPALEGVREVVISEEVVTGSARPLYIYSEQKEKKGNVSA